MRAFVFTDKALGRQAGRFVWLSINTEKKENAPVLAKYPVKVWPSFYVIDPAAEKIVLRWVGGATVPQMVRVLDDGEKAARGKSAPAAPLAEADRFYAEGKLQGGRRRVSQGARDARSPARRRTRASSSRSSSRFRTTGEREACAATARDAWRHLKATPSAANVAGSGLDCALALKDDDSRKAALVATLAADAREVVDGPKTGLAADDVSALYGTLADEREAAKDDAGRKKILESWATYLEGQAAKAKTPAERAVFDAHRTGVCLALGQPERVVPALLAVREGLPGRLQPARPPRGRVRRDAEIRRGPRGLGPRDGARVRPAETRRLPRTASTS